MLEKVKIEDYKSRRCGLYIIRHEEANNRQVKAMLAPLVCSEYHLEIANAITNVTLTQSYHNPSEKFLQMEYSFPVDPQACIYKFSAEFGTTRIEGIVKEKQEAKRQYKQAIEQGKKAAYGELNPESKDILTLKVGNVPPKTAVKIEISYLQELTLSCNTFYQLHMSSTISPRYMSDMPVEAFRNGFRNQEAKKKGQFYWNFKITLSTTRKVTFFDSHTHDIELLAQNDSSTLSEFAMTKASVPNKDFTFTFTTEDFQLPSYVFGRTDLGSTAMLSFIPKFCDLSVDDAYKASVVGKTFETDIDNARGQYIFLLDRSGSMGGARMRKAKEALVLFIKSLPEDTYFNVVSFGNRSENLFPKSVRYNDKDVDSAVNRIKKMEANLGGTQIYTPLQALITGRPIDGYPKQIFLLTDGCVSNTQGVIQMVAVNNKYSRVHSIGIGNGCSKELITGCAEKGKGEHVFINDEEDCSEKIIQLLTDSLSPVISKMKLKYDHQLVQSIIPNPESLPYILKNQLVNFYVTFKGQLEKPAVFQFAYEDSKNKLPYKSQIVIDPEVQSQSFVDRMGHFKKIRLLEDSHKNNSDLQDMMYYVKKVDKKAEIISESVRHQILSEFTAFICVEKELVDGQYQEVKDKGQLKVQIQSPPPIEYERQLIRIGTASRDLGLMRKKCKRSAPGNMPDIMMKGVIQSPQLPSSSMQMLCKSKPFTRSSSKNLQLQSVEPRRQQIKWQEEAQQKFNFKAKMLEKEEDDAQFEKSGLFTNELCKTQNEDFIMPQRKHSKRQDQCLDLKFSLKRDKRDKDEKKKEQKEESESRKKSQANLSSHNITIGISEIIAQQSTEGCWKDLTLIGILYGKQVQERVSQAVDKVAVITYLVARWIQLNHPQKQYSLVVKKGLKYVSKFSKDQGQLKTEYSDIVKA